MPRLFGFTMPTCVADPERNALFKSVLLRPFEAHHERHWDQIKAFETLVDSRGSFLRRWAIYYQQQLLMAQRFDELQEAAGKLFTWHDVDCAAGYMSNPALNGREQPSPAEFVARIVVEVATNLDMSAECRAGPREPLRPKASDFVGEEVHPPAPGVAGHVEAELQVPAGPLNAAGDADGDTGSDGRAERRAPKRIATPGGQPFRGKLFA